MEGGLEIRKLIDKQIRNYESRKIWKHLYINRLIEAGYTKKQALENYNAIHEIDYEIHPEICADDEISYGKN